VSPPFLEQVVTYRGLAYVGLGILIGNVIASLANAWFLSRRQRHRDEDERLR
jgi:hypothetical protein